jgi:hypothetical protein
LTKQLIKIILVVTLFLGVCMSQMNLGKMGWGLMIGWSIWSIALPLIMEILKESKLGIFDRGINQ